VLKFKNNGFVILTFILLVFNGVGKAQVRFQNNRTGAFLSTVFYVAPANQLPFWHRVNQYGIAPTSTPALGVRLGGHVDYDSTKRKLNFGGGFELAGNLHTNGKLILPEYYLKAKFSIFEAFIGRRREFYGLCDTTIGTGGYIWSGNSLPIPKLQIEIRQYVPLKFTKNLIAIKGTFSHGWMSNGNFSERTFLHQKSFYGRLGKPSWKVKFYGGFNHQAIWGGRATPAAGLDSNFVGKDNRFPSNAAAYLYVVTGLGGLTGSLPQNLTPFDQTNRVGNHLGTIDIGFEVDGPNYNLLVYRQNIYEDGSLFYLNSIADGLNGVVLTKLYPKQERGKLTFKKAVFEFLYTLSQGGAEFGQTNFSRGTDNYFNHQQFKDGWQYQGRIIGTPFINSRNDAKIQYDYNGFDAANNNRVRVYHVGLEGFWGENIHLFSKFSLSHNYGRYGYPYSTVPQQFSGLVQADGKINRGGGIHWMAGVAFDWGKLYANQASFQFGLRKIWGTGLN
jgi:Capsule assembly protein Wzi